MVQVDFRYFSPFLKCFGACLKTPILPHCPKIVFLQNFGDVRNEVFEKKLAFFVFLFMLEK